MRFCTFAAVAVLLLLGAGARADDLQFMPDNVQLIVSADLSKGLKTRTFLAFKKSNFIRSEYLIPSYEVRMGLSAEDLARITVGAAISEPRKGGKDAERKLDLVIVLTSTKPIAPAEVLKKSKFFEGRKLPTLKIGGQTVHYVGGREEEETLAFCFPAEKTAVIGLLSTVRAVLERNKAPELSANMQTGLKAVGPSSTVSLVVDLENVPSAHFRDGLLETIGLVPVEGAAVATKKVRAFALAANEKENVSLQATLFCRNEADARDVKSAGDAVLGFLKERPLAVLKPRPPGQGRKDIEESDVAALRSLRDATRLKVVGATVIAAAEVSPETAAGAFSAYMYFLEFGGEWTPPAKGP